MLPGFSQLRPVVLTDRTSMNPPDGVLIALAGQRSDVHIGSNAMVLFTQLNNALSEPPKTYPAI